MLRNRNDTSRKLRRGRPGRKGKRRQWGADRRGEALAARPAPATARALSGARLAIFVTLIGWAAFVVTTVSRAFFHGSLTPRYAVDAVLYVAIVSLLTASALAYLVARVGFLYRTREHQRTPRAVIDSFFGSTIPTLTVIVPSYKEDARVIRQTLLSAALQEYACLRVVLLIDDPPNPTTASDRELLLAARSIPSAIEAVLDGPRRTFERALEEFEARGHTRGEIGGAELERCASHYDEARAIVATLVGEPDDGDHAEIFLHREVMMRLADDFTAVAQALRCAAAEHASLSPARVLQLYRRLAWTFRADITSFERKRYPSLSHESNKAMNLNSYIGLMGGRYCEHDTPRGPVLLPAQGAPCDLEVPEPDYVLTLDADSILLPEYCLRLVYLMEQTEFADVGVAQTPYSSYPGARTRIERIAGASTDIQHIVHQGLTHYNATFWVGANAVLRKTALDAIAETDREHGYEIRRYIQDRTVIEDTESSVDLARCGWRLYNYPERLSYSATPPDFGSLCVQRQRWANGGLLVIAKLRRYAATLRKGRFKGGGVLELFLRANYLASIAWASLGLIVLLAYPLDGALLTPLALLTALPYFLAMSTDLKRCGYKRSDTLRIYGFNLILLSVNVSGVVKSIGQAIGGQKIAFARTPKVKNRTTAAITFVAIPYVILAYSLLTVWRDVHHLDYTHAAYAGVNAVLCGYAIVAFIGVRNSVVDLCLNFGQRVLRAPRTSDGTPSPELDWVAVLYHGAPDSSAPPTATAAATLSLVSHPADPVLHNGVVPELAVPAHSVAEILSDYLSRANDDGRLVIRLDGSDIELTVEPAVVEAG